MAKQMTDYFLYNRRYIIGYAMISLVIIGLLIIAGMFIPGGLSQAEMQSVVVSDSLSITKFDLATVVNLPYHIVQRVSLEIFGVSTISIKLPSLILGALSCLAMLTLLRSWFRQNTAVITTVLVITTGQFLFVAQNGTPGILYIFWSVLLLLAATMVSRQAKWAGVWKVTLFGTAALSLYTPLSLYILLALLSAVALHPHLRYLMRKLSKPRLIVASVCAFVLLAPLIYAIVLQPSLGLTLLGIPSAFPDIFSNVMQLARQYFNFISPGSGPLMTPVYGLGSMVLIVLGIFRLFTMKYTARSYLISTWLILLLPVLVINPTFTSVSFVPILLLMAMGISTLIRNWYQLFPLNPYARIAGLVPLAVLIGGMVLSGVDRYTYGYLYDPHTATNFSKDLYLVNKTLAGKDRGATTLLVNPTEHAFYSVVANHSKDVTAATPLQTVPSSTTTMISHAAYQDAKQAVEPFRIITDSASQNADRFYVYKTNTK